MIDRMIKFHICFRETKRKNCKIYFNLELIWHDVAVIFFSRYTNKRRLTSYKSRTHIINL